MFHNSRRERGVDAHSGLVQQEEPGRLEQGAGQPQLLLHAAGEPPGQTLGKGCELGHLHELWITLRALPAPHPLQVGVQVQVLLHAQVLIQPEALRHVADGGLNVPRLSHAVHTQHTQASGVRSHEPGRQADERGLARAVRPEQAVHRAGFEVQGHAVQGLDAPFATLEGFAYIAGNQGFHNRCNRHDSLLNALKQGLTRSRRQRRLGRHPRRPAPLWRAFPAAGRCPDPAR